MVTGIRWKARDMKFLCNNLRIGIDMEKSIVALKKKKRNIMTQNLNCISGAYPFNYVMFI